MRVCSGFDGPGRLPRRLLRGPPGAGGAGGPSPGKGGCRGMTRVPARRRMLHVACIAAAVALVATGCSHKKAAAPAKVAASASPSATPSPTPPPPPPICPLTGITPAGGTVPQRPALAIKVENAPDARPQVGLDTADMVFEE